MTLTYRDRGAIKKGRGEAKDSNRELSILEFVRDRLAIEPDERQTEVLESEAKRGILNCTRQWGKSTIAAAKAVHRAHSRLGSLVVVASPTERQSGSF